MPWTNVGMARGEGWRGWNLSSIDSRSQVKHPTSHSCDPIECVAPDGPRKTVVPACLQNRVSTLYLEKLLAQKVPRTQVSQSRFQVANYENTLGCAYRPCGKAWHRV